VRVISPGSREFRAAYDRVLARWPLPVESFDLVSEFGRTRVNGCGPDDAPPLVLLSGGGATSTVWFANVAELARDHRVFAVDTMGDVGRSQPDGRPIQGREDLMLWLDGVLDGLGLLGAAVAGHSSGAWLALSYALQAPRRVRALALIDPTQCFAELNTGYVLRAFPLSVRPSARRLRRLLRWESAGGDLDPDWLELVTLGAVRRPRPTVVTGPRPEPERLAACTVPTLVLLAERSRVHDVATVDKAVRAVLPRAVIATLPAVSHHQLPFHNASELNRQVLSFLG